jgi:hypothetical protein
MPQGAAGQAFGQFQYLTLPLLTNEGQRVAIFYTKVHNRLLRPLLAAHNPPAPLALRQALRVINHHVEDYIHEARMTA